MYFYNPSAREYADAVSGYGIKGGLRAVIRDVNPVAFEIRFRAEGGIAKIAASTSRLRSQDRSSCDRKDDTVAEDRARDSSPRQT